MVALHHLLRLMFPYEWLILFWRRFKPRDAGWSAAFAPIYIFVLWLPALAVLFASGRAATSDGAWRYLALVAAYRLADIANFYAGLFLDRWQNLLAGLERSLLCLIGNLVELVLCLGIMLQATAGESVHGSWRDALSITTYVALPDLPGHWTLVVETAGSVTALILFSGGLAMLVGVIGHKFRVGHHVGPPRR